MHPIFINNSKGKMAALENRHSWYISRRRECKRWVSRAQLSKGKRECRWPLQEQDADGVWRAFSSLPSSFNDLYRDNEPRAAAGRVVWLFLQIRRGFNSRLGLDTRQWRRSSHIYLFASWCPFFGGKRMLYPRKAGGFTLLTTLADQQGS